MTDTNDAVRLHRTRRHPVDDGHETPLELWVAEPVAGAVPLPDPPYPVLWVLDADLFFGTVVETTRLMAHLFGELPPLIVAGLAYPGAGPRLQAELRGRDFTPTVDAGFASSMRAMPGAEPTLPEGERLGGAARFAERLLGPARRIVADTCASASGRHLLFGSSLGGLFVIDLFQRHPSSFDAWIAVSPALWWDDGLLLRRAREASSDGPPPRGSVFLAVGRGEEGEHVPHLAPWRIVSNVEVLAGILARLDAPELRSGHAVIDGESHTSVVQPGLTRGLRWVFGRTGGAPA